ncbi:DUF6381 family protein [Streptomyces sp. NPDC127084]|uniref:DUF6381 family protein n=1 Tax=Streptomyces sp. NPDC127084 TaxID=3347133 RepID=UPI00366287FE
MSVAGEPGGRADQMRTKLQELKDKADRATDPQERQQLREKARQMEEQITREIGKNPME